VSIAGSKIHVRYNILLNFLYAWCHMCSYACYHPIISIVHRVAVSWLCPMNMPASSQAETPDTTSQNVFTSFGTVAATGSQLTACLFP
jgi:hypothetical protein